MRVEQFAYESDPDGIQTHDLQNRNLTLYSAKLRSLVSVNGYVRTFVLSDDCIHSHYIGNIEGRRNMDETHSSYEYWFILCRET